MTIASRLLALVERHPILAALPCPAFMSDALDAHVRHRVLVLEIACLTDSTMAALCYWIAMGCAVRSLSFRDVEGVLRTFHDALARGSAGLRDAIPRGDLDVRGEGAGR